MLKMFSRKTVCYAEIACYFVIFFAFLAFPTDGRVHAVSAMFGLWWMLQRLARLFHELACLENPSKRAELHEALAEYYRKHPGGKYFDAMDLDLECGRSQEKLAD